MNPKIGGETMIPEYLNKVNSDKKALELAAILEACRPTHAQRLFFVGFLKFCNYTMPEVIDIIHEHCQWNDYNETVTAYQVGSIYHKRPQRTQNHTTRKPRRWDLSKLEILKIRRQRSISLSHILCEESKQIKYPHPERLGHFNSWAEFLRK